MPLHFRSVDDKAQPTCEEMSLAFEMPESDFGGPANVNWYYDTFLSPLNRHEDSEYNVMKRALADWINAPGNIDGPFYIMEGDTQGHGGICEELRVVLLDPNDILSFQNHWSAHFQFNPQSALQNLRHDIWRIEEKHFQPADLRLRDIYARYAACNPAPQTPEQKQAALIRALLTPDRYTP